MDQLLDSRSISDKDEVSEYEQELPDLQDARKYNVALRLSLITSIISAILVLGLQGFMYGAINLHRDKFRSRMRYFEMLIFLALFIFAEIYQVAVTWTALATKNVLLLCMLCCFYACLLIYTGVQYREISLLLEVVDKWKTATKATNVATIVLLAITLIVQVLLVWFLLLQSVLWLKFKKIGASIAIKRMYTVFQLHRTVLIFDFFFFLAFTVQFLVIMVSKTNSVEFILTCCMLPLTVVVLVAADFAASRELLWLSSCTVICFVCGCVYVLFKMIRLFTKYTSAYDAALQPGDYFPGRTSLVTFGVITLVFLLLTLVLEVMLMCNYNKGLLPVVSGYYRTVPFKKRQEEVEPILID